MKNIRVNNIILSSLLLLIILMSVSIVSLSSVDAAAYYWGTSGEQVKTIQTKLKQWGYYTGQADGIYGTQTSIAVKKFQAKNGLKADGVVGNQTLAKLGIQASNAKQSSSNKAIGGRDATIIAAAINGEARGESYVGMVAVGAVILNRTKDSRFPHTISGVIYQPGAFTAVSDGQINLSPSTQSVNAARDALNGWDPTGGCVYYWNPSTATSKWIWSRNIVTIIGKHYFGK